MCSLKTPLSFVPRRVYLCRLIINLAKMSRLLALNEYPGRTSNPINSNIIAET